MNIVDLKKYLPTDDKADATGALLKALEDARGLENPVLSFPEGVWHFWPDKALEKHYFISNNDAGLKRMVLPIIDFDGLTIEGNGAELMVHGRMLPIVVDHSRNITIRNLTIDAPIPFYGQGHITGAGDDFVEFTIDREKFCGSVEAGRLVFYTDEFEYEPTDQLFLEEFNAERIEPEYKKGHTDVKFRANTGDPYMVGGAPVVVASEKDGKVRLTTPQGNLPNLFTVGNELFIGFEKRNNPGMFLTQSDTVTLENITVYHAGAMALIGQLTRDITVKKMHLGVRAGSGRVVSAAGDATHFVHCTGTLTIEDSIFENMMDDGTNIHGIYTTLSEIQEPNVILVQFMHYQQWGVPLYEKGDVIRFINHDDLTPKGEATIEKVDVVNCQYARLTLNRSIEDIAKLGDSIETPYKMPSAVLRRNRSGNNRSRGFLLNSMYPIVVEDCIFHNSGDGISINGDAFFWYESGPVTDITIRRNHFADVGYGYGGRPITINPEVDPEKVTIPYHRNVLIEDNDIDLVVSGVIRAASCGNLTIRNNRLRKTTKYPFWTADRDEVVLESCPDAVVEPFIVEE